MKVVIQRVSSASVTVDGKIIASINEGILALVGFGEDDLNKDFNQVVTKILNLRIFSNQEGRFDFSLLERQGEILLVPQFTLYADTSKGRRPEFFKAMNPQNAAEHFQRFVDLFREKYPNKVSTGQFGAMMEVALVNDGPVTILLET